MRFAKVGTGVRPRHQLPIRRETPGAGCGAFFDRTQATAEALARDRGLPIITDDLDTLRHAVGADIVDNMIEARGHSPLSFFSADPRLRWLGEAAGAGKTRIVYSGRLGLALPGRGARLFGAHHSARSVSAGPD